MIKNCLTRATLILILADSFAYPKAYFAPFDKMVRDASAIAVIETVSLQPASKAEDGAQFRDWLITAKLIEPIHGDLTTPFDFYIRNSYPCATVDVKPGTYLVFLSSSSTYSAGLPKDAMLPRSGLFNSNWRLSFRPLVNGTVELLESNQWKSKSLSLKTIRKRIRRLLGKPIQAVPGH